MRSVRTYDKGLSLSCFVPDEYFQNYGRVGQHFGMCRLEAIAFSSECTQAQVCVVVYIASTYLVHRVVMEHKLPWPCESGFPRYM